MQQQVKHRRPHGTGHLKLRRDRARQPTYCGKFTVPRRAARRSLTAVSRSRILAQLVVARKNGSSVPLGA
jgi:hypothetical protein